MSHKPFTPQDVERAELRLMASLRSKKFFEVTLFNTGNYARLPGLPDGQGGYRVGHFQELAAEFMLMQQIRINHIGLVFSFKHRESRNYLYCPVSGQYAVYVPITQTPFLRGTFDVPA